LLAGAQVDAMEQEAEGEFREHVPSGLARYLLVRLTPLLAQALRPHVPVSMAQEIAGGDLGEDPLSWVAPRYTRKLCLHALHDVGQAMVDAPWIQGCTGFVAGGSRTVGGHWLLARNWDFDGGRYFDEDKAVIAVRRDGVLGYVHVAIPGLAGVVSGINEAGIGAALFAAGSNARLRLATPMIFVLREVMETARSLEDVHRILDARRGMVTEAVLAVDGRAGGAAVFEVTPDDVTRIDAGNAGAEPVLALSNHLRGAHASDVENLRRMASGTTIARLARMDELLAAAGPLDAAGAIAILTDTRAMGGAPLPAGHEAAINARNTSHAFILDATAGAIWVSRAPNVDGGFVRFDVAGLLAGTLRGERVSPAIAPHVAIGVHRARDRVRAAPRDEANLLAALVDNPADPDATLALARLYAGADRAADAARLLDGYVPERPIERAEVATLRGEAP
jgi:hypothetical protein